MTDIQLNTDSSTVDATSKLFDGMRAVILDRFSIEEGEQLAGKGMTVGLGGASISVQSTSNKELGLIGFTTDFDFAGQESDSGGSFSGSELQTKADGIYYGFKPSIELTSVSTNLTGTGKRDLFRHTIEATGANKFLDFVDLTGTYLATTSNLAYVISHEIDHTKNLSGDGNRYHNLILDKNIVGNTSDIKILQPNHVCFYSFSPEKITINEMSNKYTKEATKKEYCQCMLLLI